VKKRCRVCDEVKLVSDFKRRRDSPDGYRNECRACKNAYENERVKRVRRINPEKGEKMRGRGRRWQARNLEKERERWRQYDADNREKRRLARARFRAEQPELDREIRQKWRAANPHRMRDYFYRHYEFVRDATPNTRDYIAVLLGDPCSYCDKPMDHIDHIVPRTRDGSHHWTNLTAACASCNPGKSNKPLLLWLADR
jgi:5-methylcytosine-specific restriction endonuclease McrA